MIRFATYCGFGLILLWTYMPPASAQNIASKTFYLLDEDREEMRPDYEYRWYYDAKDRNTQNEGWYWDQDLNSFVPAFRIENEYLTSGQLSFQYSRFWEEAGIRATREYWMYDGAERAIAYTQERKLASEDLFEVFQSWEIIYDDNDCLHQQTFSQGSEATERITTYTNEECRPDSLIEEKYRSGTGWQNNRRSLYQYQDSLAVREESKWENNQWTASRRLELRYRPDGLLVEWKAISPDSSQYRIEYAYDLQGQRIYQAESQWAVGDSIWFYFYAEHLTYNVQGAIKTQTHEYSFDRETLSFRLISFRENFYDEKGRKQEEQLRLYDFQFGPDPLITETLFRHAYQDYCDGSLQQEEIFRDKFGQTQLIQRLEYGYSETANCVEKVHPLTIAPNPAGESLSFNSGFLRGEEVLIRIFDLQQRLLYTESVGYRSTHYIVPIQWLPPAYYMLEVYSPNGVGRAKFVKLP